MLKAKRSSPLSNIKWSFLKDPRILSAFVLLFILVALPFTLFEVKQQQTSQQHASTKIWNSGYDSCGHIHVLRLSETPDCASQTANINSYYTTVALQSVDGYTYTVHVYFDAFWCKDQSELGDNFGNPYACVKRDNPLIKDFPVGGSAISINANTQQPTSGFSYCGTYQDDFSFYYTDRSGNTCRFGWPALDPDPNHQVVADGYCTTLHVNCTAATPTPTPTNIPSATPTPTSVPSATPTLTITPTDIPSDTPSPTASPSATPTDTPAATPTVTPTGTLTPTLSPTATPTGNPTATPTLPPGVTPTPTIIVAKPTLPPTGPSNTVMAVGLVGVAISVLGLALLIGI